MAAPDCFMSVDNMIVESATELIISASPLAALVSDVSSRITMAAWFMLQCPLVALSLVLGM